MEKQEEINFLENQKAEIETELNRIENVGTECADEYLAEIEKILPKLQERETSEGNISMKEHLLNVKEEVTNNKQKYVDDRKDKLNSILQRINEDLNKLQNDD